MRFYRYDLTTGDILAEMSSNIPFDEMMGDDMSSLVKWQEGTGGNSHYVEDGELKKKSVIAIASTDKFLPVGEKSIVITDLPTGAWVRIRGTKNMFFEEITVRSQDNHLVFAPPMEGGYVAYLVGKYTGNEVTFEAISVEKLKSRLLDQVNEKRTQVLDAGMVWNGSRWDVDSVSQASITNIVASVNAGQTLPEGFYWRDFDDNNVPMSESDMSALGNAVIAFNFAVHSKGSALKALIGEASTLDEVLAIDIHSGWPE